MPVVEVVEGSSPVILGLPHTGTQVPANIWNGLNENGRLLADTDWHVHRLYENLLPDATSVRALFHRYVVDANRDPQGESLYPGQNTTGLVPMSDFDGIAIWRDGSHPRESDIASRLSDFHAPYHAAISAQIARVKALHGKAILFDCHSIRSLIPFLFDGTLPDFNIGTDSGKTSDPAMEAAVTRIVAASGRSHVVNGRFRGGWTSRHYGRPGEGVHAIQMELAQSAYLRSERPPFAFDAAKAGDLRRTLKAVLRELDVLGRDNARS